MELYLWVIILLVAIVSPKEPKILFLAIDEFF